MARHLLGAFLLLSAPLFAQQNQLTPEQESSLKYQAGLEITIQKSTGVHHSTGSRSGGDG